MKTQSFLTRLALLVPLLLVSSQAFAQQWYHVELIVFERLSGANAEFWPAMDDVRSGSLSPQMSNTQIQPASAGNLSGVAERLRNSSNYRVHYHKAWQQPIFSKGSAKSVQVNSDNGLIEGVIKLYRLSYLHADIDVWFKENGSAASAVSGAPRNPQLSQIRRIRSKELTYFDHPRVAAVLQLTPVAAPGSAVSKTPESYSLPEAEGASEGQ